MIAGIWGKKVGMTQVFVNNKVVPVTVIDVAHWVVTQVKTQASDGYSAVQIGGIKKKYVNEPFSPAWLQQPKKYFAALKEVRLDADAQNVTVGAPLDVSTILAVGDAVDIFGKTRGCGFSGVIKRHDFNGPPGSHGSTMGKRPGSMSFMRSRGRVIKGKRLPGQFGNESVVMQNLEVINVESGAHMVTVKGSIPGKTGSLVFLRKA